ncbi:MAG: PHP domain-containing protein [Christensenellaceae bacterium]|jgi:putative hydrolase|nr:PHP domain-containing protein [Christensenellaceae bacterium]
MIKKITGDYHTHTKYSDGHTSCLENITYALKAGLAEIAITDHGFNNPSRYSLTREKYQTQRKEIGILRDQFNDKINILHGVEADIIACDGTIDATKSDIQNMDVLILGYHSFAKSKSTRDWRKLYLNSFLSALITPSKEVIKRNTQALIYAIKKYPIDILAHINHLLKVDCYLLSSVASDYGVLIELNEKHINFDDDIFARMLTTKVNFIINSDAHRKENVGAFPHVEAFLKKHTVPEARIVNISKTPQFKNKS